MHLSSSKLGHCASKPLLRRTIPISLTSHTTEWHHRHRTYRILPIFFSPAHPPPPPPPRPPSATNSNGWGDNDDDDHNNENNDQNHPPNNTSTNISHTLIHFFLKSILPWLLATLITTTALLALLPQLLSHPTALKTALALLNNTISPAKIYIESLSLGWTIPLTIKGLKVTEKMIVKKTRSPLNGAVMYTEESDSDSDIEEEEEEEEDGMDIHTDRNNKPTKKHNNNNNKKPSSSSSTMKPERKAVLFTADTIYTTAPLYKLVLLQQGITDMFIKHPVIDGSLNARGQVRLARMLEEAGLVPKPPPPAVPSSSSSPSSSSLGSNTMIARYQALIQPRRNNNSNVKKGGGNNGEGDDEEKEVGTSNQAFDASITSTRRTNDEKDKNNTLSKVDMCVPEYLQVPDSQIKLTAEVRTPFLHIYIADGVLQVPEEVKELVGRRLHVDVLQGASAISEAINNEFPIDNSNNNKSGNGNSAPPSPPSSSSGVWWAREKPSVLLPWRAGSILTPVALRIDSDRLSLSMSGWQTSKRYTYLHDPVSLQAELTPSLAQTVLSRVVRPVLGSNNSSSGDGGVVGLKSSIKVKATARPADGLWPTGGMMTVVVEPLQVAVGEGAAVRQALALLTTTAMNSGSGSSGGGSGSDNDDNSKSFNTKVPAVHSKGGLTADLSRIVTDISMNSGAITTQRVDVSIRTNSGGGGGGGGLLPWGRKKRQGGEGGGVLRFATWGEAHASRNGPMDVTLAIPASTLAAVGLLPSNSSSSSSEIENKGDGNDTGISNKKVVTTVESLPDDWAVGITLTGTVNHPKIQRLGEASKLLGTLMMRNSAAADVVSSKLKLPRWIAVGISGVGRGNVADMGVRMPPLP